MTQFSKLIGITMEHGYYKNVTGKFRIAPTAKTETLMRNRGVLFRQTDDGCQWLIADDFNGFLPDDRLECALQVLDAAFMYVTQLEGYQPQSFYRLSLSGKSQTVDVVSALVPADAPSMSSSCFCHISIGLTPEMQKEAKDGKPLEYRLKFNKASYLWEYLFVRRNADTDESKILLLEDTTGDILFSLSKKLPSTPYGDMAWQIVSTSPILCRQNPTYNLLLFEIPMAEFIEELNDEEPRWQERLAKEIKKDIEETKREIEKIEKDMQAEDFSTLPVGVWSGIIAKNSLKKRLLSRFLPYPQPGRFKVEPEASKEKIPDKIRQVCYI